jgi:hypothetical protein
MRRHEADTKQGTTGSTDKKKSLFLLSATWKRALYFLEGLCTQQQKWGVLIFSVVLFWHFTAISSPASPFPVWRFARALYVYSTFCCSQRALEISGGIMMVEGGINDVVKCHDMVEWAIQLVCVSLSGLLRNGCVDLSRSSGVGTYR